MERPCPKRWDELVGDEKRRFCSSCALHVTNLSALDAEEAEEFLATSRGRVCVAFVAGPPGRVSRRPATGVARLLPRLARAASFLCGLVFLLPGCRPEARRDAAAVPPEDAPGAESRRILGRVRADPVCQIDDGRELLGEMLVEPEPPAPVPAEH